MQQVLCGAAVRRDVVADCFEPGDIAHSDGHNAATAAYKQTAHRRVTHRLAESFQRWCARLAQRGAHTFERDVQTLFAEGLEQIALRQKFLGQRRGGRLGLHDDARNSPAAGFFDRLNAVDAARDLLAVAVQRVATP